MFHEMPKYVFRASWDMVDPGSGDAEGSEVELTVLVRRTPFEGFGCSHYLVVLKETYVEADDGLHRLDPMMVTLPLSASAVEVLANYSWEYLNSTADTFYKVQRGELEKLTLAAIRSVGTVSRVEVCWASDTGQSKTFALRPGETARDPFGYHAERKRVARELGADNRQQSKK